MGVLLATWDVAPGPSGPGGLTVLLVNLCVGYGFNFKKSRTEEEKPRSIIG